MKLTKKQVIEYIKMELQLFEWDFNSKKYGNKAKLLHKHYKEFLRIIEEMK